MKLIHPYKSAYTLVELLVTIAVIALLTAFAIPTYQLVMSQEQLGAAADQVTDLMRLSEQKTLTEQIAYGVTLTAGATTIPQFKVNADGSLTTISTYSLPANVVIDQVNFSGTTNLRFTTAGAPTVSGNLVLRDTIRNRHKQILVKPSGSITNDQGEY